MTQQVFRVRLTSLYDAQCMMRETMQSCTQIPNSPVPKSAALNFQASVPAEVTFSLGVISKQALGGGGGREVADPWEGPPTPYCSTKLRRGPKGRKMFLRPASPHPLSESLEIAFSFPPPPPPLKNSYARAKSPSKFHQILNYMHLFELFDVKQNKEYLCHD